MQPLEAFLRWFAGTPVYDLALGFVAAYPIVTGLMCTLTSLILYAKNERDPLPPQPDDELPFTSVIVAAYCEEAVIWAARRRPRTGRPSGLRSTRSRSRSGA